MKLANICLCAKKGHEAAFKKLSKSGTEIRWAELFTAALT
jgi:hypothetical protein